MALIIYHIGRFSPHRIYPLSHFSWLHNLSISCIFVSDNNNCYINNIVI